MAKNRNDQPKSQLSGYPDQLGSQIISSKMFSQEYNNFEKETVKIPDHLQNDLVLSAK